MVFEIYVILNLKFSLNLRPLNLHPSFYLHYLQCELIILYIFALLDYSYPMAYQELMTII